MMSYIYVYDIIISLAYHVYSTDITCDIIYDIDHEIISGRGTYWKASVRR